MVTDKAGREVRVGDILTYQGGYNYRGGENCWYHVGGRVQVIQLLSNDGLLPRENLLVERLDETDPDLSSDLASYVEATYFTKETTMAKDKHGVDLQQHDIVRFAGEYNAHSRDEEQRAPVGTLGVVNYVSWYNSVAVALARNGVTVLPPYTKIEKVPGRWLPATEVRGPFTDVTGTLVRLRNDVSAGIGLDFLKGGVHLLKRTVGEHPFRDFRIKSDDVRYQFSDANFEVFVPEAAAVLNPKAQAMTFDTARGYVAQFKELGVRTRVRQRSWDDEARYAALEELDPAGNVVKKLYRAIDCHERLQELRAAAVPTDVLAIPRGVYVQFKTPEGAVIEAPDRSSTWSLAEIKAAKGIAWHEGKKYRLCITRIVPLYNETTGEATAS